MGNNAKNNRWISNSRDVVATISSILKITTIGLVVGGVSATLALAFINGVEWLNDYLFISSKSRFLLSENPLLLTTLTIVMPTLGGLMVGLIMKYVSDLKRPIGPADVIYGVQSREIKSLSIKEGFASSLSALLALGFGASVGQYGPVVTMGGVIGVIARRLRINVENVVTIGVACGVAAAISAAFNAPIAGILFAHEAIVRHYSLQTFAPVTVASAVGYIIANVVFQRTPFFEVTFAGIEYGYEFILFGVLGIISALIAYTFMRTILMFNQAAQKLTCRPEFKPALAGLILGIVALFTPEVLGIGKEALRFATIEGAFMKLNYYGLLSQNSY
jgi:Chloride channel protein EriC